MYINNTLLNLRYQTKSNNLNAYEKQMMSFKNSNTDTYASSKFLKKNPPLYEIDAAEETIDNLISNNIQIDKTDILYKTGRIFENAQAYNQAKQFYYRTMELLPDTRKREIEFDIKRVEEKENQ